MEGWREDPTIAPDFVRDNEVGVAVAGEEVAGFYALAGGVLCLEHLRVSSGWIGRGIGRALPDHAVRRAAALGVAVVRIEADPNAEGFYRGMGARRVGENVYVLDGWRRVLPLPEIEAG